MQTIKVTVFETEKDGLPDMSVLTGRVAFLFDGSIVSGWPLYPEHSTSRDEWEADGDVGRHGRFCGIKKYIVFEKPVYNL